MSAFHVRGVSFRHCLKMAERQLNNSTDKDGEFVSMSEYIRRRAEIAEGLFLTCKPVQISEAFDAPSFARDWMELAAKSDRVRDLQLYATYPVMEGGRQRTTARGTPMYECRPYSG